MLPTPELNAMALRIMQEELAERQRDRLTTDRDAHGHPPPSPAPFSFDDWAVAA